MASCRAEPRRDATREGGRNQGKASQGGAAPGCHRPAPARPIRCVRAVRPRDATRGRRGVTCARASALSRSHPTARPPHGVRASRNRSHPLWFSASARQPRIRPPHARPSPPAPGTPEGRGMTPYRHEGVACPAEEFTWPVQWRGAAFRRCWFVFSLSGQATTCRLGLGTSRTSTY